MEDFLQCNMGNQESINILKQFKVFLKATKNLVDTKTFNKYNQFVETELAKMNEEVSRLSEKFGGIKKYDDQYLNILEDK